ncbi:hypothetical protein [Paenibacillus sp.]|uniref:hypothetical protein n=1 Tax=Paenibacillus sp. TaxID=58172 RepID=UPI002D2A1A45|nr:hypothetical protein [Paenibacillus sp.]HZG55960.1 hypothetical protein [Paenibacillus sp.]
MISLAWVLLISYSVAAGAAYRFLYLRRLLIGYHLGMNMAMTSAGVLGISVGALLGTLYPLAFTEMALLSAAAAAVAGGLFGAMVDYQTFLTGVTSGVMSGLMGPMLGVMASDPDLTIALCTVLVYGGFSLLCYSVRS